MTKQHIALVCSVLLIWGAVSATAQREDDVSHLEKGVVRIISTSDGIVTYGTGCIVGFTKEQVFIVTCAHVVRGDKHPNVEFTVARGTQFKSTVTTQEAYEPGLALLAVERKDERLAVLVSLPPTSVPNLSRGDKVAVIGNPREAPWSVLRPGVQSIRGRDITLDTQVEAGYSGAPLIKDGKMQGMVFDSDGMCSSAMHSDTVWLYLNNGTLPSGLLQGTADEADPEYVVAKRQLKDWGFEFTDRAFIDSVIGGQVKAVRAYLVANPAWARLPFDARVLVKGYTPGANENSTSFAISALMLAAMSGQADVVKELVRAKGLDDSVLSLDDVELGTPLMVAVMNGDTETVRLLVEAGANINKCDGSGNTALTRALQMGEYPDIEDALGDMAIGVHKNSDQAAYLKIVEVLLKAGADPSPESRSAAGPQESPLRLAVKSNRTDLIALLLDAKADASVGLEEAVISDSKDIVRLLLTKAKMPQGESLVCSAAENCDLDMMKLLISKGASVDGKERLGRTALHIAVSKCSKDIVQYLVSKGADVNAVRQLDWKTNGWTPLHEAAARGDVAVATLLLANGAKINAKTDGESGGKTPLSVAAEAGKKDVAELLLKRKADPNARCQILLYTDPTLLHMVVDKHDLAMVRLLLHAGANPNVTCDRFDGYRDVTPLHLAAENGDTEIADVLIQAGAKVNASARIVTKDSVCTGWSPLHLAAGQGRAETVKLLARHGASLRAATSNGWTPSTWARTNQRHEVVDVLAGLLPPGTVIDVSGESPSADDPNRPVDPWIHQPPGSR